MLLELDGHLCQILCKDFSSRVQSYGTPTTPDLIFSTDCNLLGNFFRSSMVLANRKSCTSITVMRTIHETIVIRARIRVTTPLSSGGAHGRLEIVKCTTGIVTLGTPFKKTDAASAAKIRAGVVSALGGQS